MHTLGENRVSGIILRRKRHNVFRNVLPKKYGYRIPVPRVLTLKNSVRMSQYSVSILAAYNLIPKLTISLKSPLRASWAQPTLGVSRKPQAVVCPCAVCLLLLPVSRCLTVCFGAHDSPVLSVPHANTHLFLRLLPFGPLFQLPQL